MDDILSELERQAGPLEKEAQRAEQYRQYEQELTALDISLLVRDIELLQERWKDVAANVDQAARQRQIASEVLKQSDLRLQQAKAKFDAKNAEAEAVQKQLLEAVESRQRTEGNLELARERAKNAEQSIADRERQRSQMSEDKQALESQVHALSERKGRVEAQLQIKTAELEAAAYAVDPAERQRLEREIEQLNADLIEYHHKAAALRNELKMSEESMSQEGRKKARLEEDRQRWEQELQKYQELRKRLHEEGNQVMEVLHRNAVELMKRHSLRERAQEEASVVTKIHQAKSLVASLQSKYELLRELEEGYDGYALGAKTVLQNAAKGRLQGVHGPLASLVQVPKQYETAIETALGGTVQNIVVSTEADARAAIEMLKQRQAGRATFMPLSVIRGRSIAPGELAKVTGVEGYSGSQAIWCVVLPSTRRSYDICLATYWLRKAHPCERDCTQIGVPSAHCHIGRRYRQPRWGDVGRQSCAQRPRPFGKVTRKE